MGRRPRKGGNDEYCATHRANISPLFLITVELIGVPDTVACDQAIHFVLDASVVADVGSIGANVDSLARVSSTSVWAERIARNT
jgi:hypothetical protein